MEYISAKSVLALLPENKEQHLIFVRSLLLDMSVTTSDLKAYAERLNQLAAYIKSSNL